MTGSSGSVTDTRSIDALCNTFTPRSSTGTRAILSHPDSDLMGLSHCYYDPFSDCYSFFDHDYTAIGQSQSGPLGGGGAIRFFNLDQQGSSSTLTDSSQNVTDQHSRDTFGNLHAPECLITTPDPYGYGAAFGYQSDVNSGLYQVGHRYYDPSTGRFLSRDPIQDGYNWYAYVNNDPVNNADPTGLENNGGGAKNKTKNPVYVIIGDVGPGWTIEIPPADRQRGPHPGTPYILKPNDPKKGPVMTVYPVPDPLNSQQQDKTGNFLAILPPGKTIPVDSGLDVDNIWDESNQVYWRNRGHQMAVIEPGKITTPWSNSKWPAPPPGKIIHP